MSEIVFTSNQKSINFGIDIEIDKIFGLFCIYASMDHTASYQEYFSEIEITKYPYYLTKYEVGIGSTELFNNLTIFFGVQYSQFRPIAASFISPYNDYDLLLRISYRYRK